MKNLSKHTKRMLIITIIALIVIVVLSLYKLDKIRLLDKHEYKMTYKALEEDAENFKSQKDLYKYIIEWAKSNNLEYTVDDSYNIIFEKSATPRKSKVSPTVLVINYNYENVIDNKKALATAAVIAKADLNSGKKTVIFVNNKYNDGSSYAALDSSYFPDNAKVIFLDYGKNCYVSSTSFASTDQTISVPTETEPVSCDTAIKIKIGGLTSDTIDTSINKQISPVSLFSTILTRLKSKSTICQLADFKLSNKGKMYPDAIEATILLNSYQLNSFTKYLDKRIKAFDKSKKKDFPDAYYSYEVIENVEEFPTSAYTKDTFDSLTTILYALKNGSYRYENDDDIVSGYEVDDIYGISCVNQIRNENEQILIDVHTQANSKKVMNEMINDNTAASVLSNCTIKTNAQIKAFNNPETRLVNTIRSTYFKVNDLSGTSVVLNYDNDTYFTSMSYLSQINNNLDIIHLKENSKSASVITNTLLCYIQTKGNFLSL